MMVKPAVTDLLKKVDNRYSLVIMTSKRARQLAEGEEPMIECEDKSPVTIAVNEIYDEKVFRINENKANTDEIDNKE